MGNVEHPPEIPDKFWFKIGEVGKILDVKPYVIRFWETEFDITPAKSRSKHRMYKRNEVETLLEIRRMLHVERFTIEGARALLKERMKAKTAQLNLDLKQDPLKVEIKRIRKGLAEIRDILSRT